LKFVKRKIDTRKVIMLVIKDVIFIALSLRMSRTIIAPINGRKIVVESTGKSR
jgi:hypothetical protein